MPIAPSWSCLPSLCEEWANSIAKESVYQNTELLHRRYDQFGMGLRKEGMKPKLPMNKVHLRVILLFLASVLCTLATVGCNTMHGLGRDVENTGEKIERAATR